MNPPLFLRAPTCEGTAIKQWFQWKSVYIIENERETGMAKLY